MVATAAARVQQVRGVESMGQVIVLVQKICETCVHDPDKDGVNCPVDDGDFCLCGAWALSTKAVDYTRTGVDVFKLEWESDEQ